MHVEPGELLASGTLAWELDSSDLMLALEEAKAAENVAEKQLAEAEAGVRREELDRLSAVVSEATFFLSQIRSEKVRQKKLFVNDLLSASKWDEIGFREKMAESQLAATKAALASANSGQTLEQKNILKARRDQARVHCRQAKKRVDDTRVKAPRLCWVVGREKNAGDMIRAGEPILHVISLNPIKVQFYVGEQERLRLKPGISVSLNSPVGGPTFPATLTRIIPEGDSASRRVPCEATLNNPSGDLIPGQSALIHIPMPKIGGTIIPISAVLRDRRLQPRVLVIRNGVVTSQPVQVLGTADGKAAVVGVAPDENVVSRGGLGLQDGAKVKIRNH